MTPSRLLLLLALGSQCGSAWAPPVDQLVVRALRIQDAELELEGEVKAAEVAGTEEPARKAQIVLRLDLTSIANPAIRRTVIHRYELPDKVRNALGRRETLVLPRLGAPWPTPPADGWRFDIALRLVVENRDGKTEERASTGLAGSHIGAALSFLPSNLPARRLDDVPELALQGPPIEMSSGLPEDRRPKSEPGTEPRRPQLSEGNPGTPDLSPLTRSTPEQSTRGSRPADAVSPNDLSAPRLGGVPDLDLGYIFDRLPTITFTADLDQTGSAPIAPPASASNDLSASGARTMDRQPLLLPTSTSDISAPQTTVGSVALSGVKPAPAPGARTWEATDLDAQVQQVLRESSRETAEDLAYWRERMRLYEEARKRAHDKLREQENSLPDAQKARERYADTPDEAGDAAGTMPAPTWTTEWMASSMSASRSSTEVSGTGTTGSTAGASAQSDGFASGRTARLTAGVPLPPIASEMYVTANTVENLTLPASPPAPPLPGGGPVLLDQTSANAFAMAFAASEATALPSNVAGPPATAVQAADAQLDAFDFSTGSPGSFVNVQRGTTSSPAAETGGDSLITWGRWTDGTRTGTTIGTSTLTTNQGFHYAVGAATPAGNIPASGTATFTLMGATKPTFGDGAFAPGTFTGSMVVQWAGAASTKVGVDFTIAMPGDASYRLISNGGLANPAISQITTSTFTGSSFTGQLSTFSPGEITVTGGPGRACGTPCFASVSGFFAGQTATRAGVVYNVGTTPATSIQGAASFTR